MSEKTKAILGTVVSVLVTIGAVASEWQDMGPAFVKWALRVVALLTVLSNVLGLKVVSLRRADPGKAAGAGAVMLGVLLIAVSATACGPSPAVIATHGTMRAAQLTGDTLAKVHKAGKLKCDAVKKWRTHGRQAARLAISGAVIAIKAQKDPDYIEILKPGACELFRWLDSASKDAPPEASKAMAYLGAFKALVCPKGKSAAGIASTLGVILPAAQAIIEYILGLAGASDDKLLAEVDAYLAAPAQDGTDAVCKD
jgi:hypothetical protein